MYHPADVNAVSFAASIATTSAASVASIMLLKSTAGGGGGTSTAAGASTAEGCPCPDAGSGCGLSSVLLGLGFPKKLMCLMCCGWCGESSREPAATSASALCHAACACQLRLKGSSWLHKARLMEAGISAHASRIRQRRRDYLREDRPEFHGEKG